ncbi:MAG: acetylglutamate kinase [Firmicutes bacterium]|nr:acetylglutamate kinase [Bacillota bacterium]
MKYIATPMRIPPTTPKPPIGTIPPDCDHLLKQYLVNSAMRVVWLDHVYWTRLLLVSIAERLKDESATATRLLQNPADIAAVFANFYPAEITNKITDLLTEHLKIGAALITALRNNKNSEAEELNRRWYINADDMAKAFASINPNYDYNEMRKMLNTHLDNTTKEVAARLKGDYNADIAAFEIVKNQAIEMADSLSNGLADMIKNQY